MVDVTPFLPGLPPVQGKAVVARFDGGRLSSEGGLLALREIERRLGLADRLAGCLKDPRTPEKVVHRVAEIIRFRMLMIAAGYEDGTTPTPCAPIRCSSWRSIACPRARSCAHNRPSRGWKISPTCGRCCAWGEHSSSNTVARSGRCRSVSFSISTIRCARRSAVAAVQCLPRRLWVPADCRV